MSDPITPAVTLAAAELRVQAARERLNATMAQLQDRLDPRARVQKVKRDARIAGETAVAIAREKPVQTGGVLVAAALAIGVVFGRHRIARLFAKPRPDTPPATAGLNPVTRTEP